MNFPFFNRLQLKKIVVPTASESGRRAEKMLVDIVQELPELLLGYIVDTQSGSILSFYTVSNSYNPNQLSLRNTKLLRTMQEALANKAWVGGPLTDVSIILEDQIHHLRPLNELGWYCFAAARLADSNMGMVKEVVRRCTS
ncbi:hypothetical protein E4631_02025 [Hymenobacter sp. UV11]|uniref:hypothetical protein n=1 Tax=Hymenobacter sp. UV11 TaxID=1849735 RepID=UPI001060F292|nr:hypothetical protein [Hymenobacter sp. UV11]TDN37662.1 hypothetical protein A8B98_03850 [Hymenobacter sp. UV11]TFZ68860.1 hypothetical protein E4631_02025 [Hymenobacter sp. UV11]